MQLAEAMESIQAEYKDAREKFGGFASAHEAYAIILEELDEFFDSVKAGKADPVELIQVGAMALAGLVELDFADAAIDALNAAPKPENAT